MSKNKNPNIIDIIKFSVGFISLMTVVFSLLKKLVGYLNDLDSDKQKWDESFGEELEKIINKYRQEESVSPIVEQAAPVKGPRTKSRSKPRPEPT